MPTIETSTTVIEVWVGGSYFLFTVDEDGTFQEVDAERDPASRFECDRAIAQDAVERLRA